MVAKKEAQETFLRSVLQNEGRCWIEFYKYDKLRKGNRENIPAIKENNSKLVTYPIVKTTFLNSYYASLFSCERSNSIIQSTESGKPFTISINLIRKRLLAIGRKKSVGLDGIPGEILNLGREVFRDKSTMYTYIRATFY
jgi:hypothetical protein